jgi:hypothetical protein
MGAMKKRGLRAQRREVAEALVHLRACRQEAARRRVALGACIHDRVASPETLSLAFVAGLTTAMLAPQGRRGDPPERRRPATGNRALKTMLRLGRMFAMREMTSAVVD